MHRRRRRASNALMPRDAAAENDMVEFPLRRGIGRVPGCDPQDLDVKRVPLHQIGRKRVATQRLRDAFAEAGKLPLRRGP